MRQIHSHRRAADAPRCRAPIPKRGLRLWLRRSPLRTVPESTRSPAAPRFVNTRFVNLVLHAVKLSKFAHAIKFAKPSFFICPIARRLSLRASRRSPPPHGEGTGLFPRYRLGDRFTGFLEDPDQLGDRVNIRQWLGELDGPFISTPARPRSEQSPPHGMSARGVAGLHSFRLPARYYRIRRNAQIFSL